MAFTGQQLDFIKHHVHGGCAPTEAARRAGYRNPAQRAYELTRNSAMQDALREERTRVVGSLATTALRTLDGIMADKAAPAAARVSAARTSLELAGMLGRQGGPGERKTVAEMSPAELQATLDGAKAALLERERRARPILDVKPADSAQGDTQDSTQAYDILD